MSRTQVIDQQGKKILYIDFSYLKSYDEIKAVTEEAQKYIHAQPANSVLTLTTVEETHFNNEIREMFTNYIKSNMPFVKARAILGVTGLKLVLYNGMQRFTGSNMRAFSNTDEAKRWLISQ